MKTIGIIGGIGPQATMDFEKRVHEISPKYIPANANAGYPSLWIRYLRVAPIKRNEDGSPVLPFTPSDELIETAEILGRHSDFIVITSNSPHKFAKEIEEASGKKVLNMIELVVEKIKEKQYKKIGIMLVSGTIKNGLYQNSLNAKGIFTEVTGEEFNLKLDQAIFRVMAGQETNEDRRLAEEGLEYLRKKGCQAIILGCTEIPFLLEDDINENDIINPIAILAEEAVKYAIK